MSDSLVREAVQHSIFPDLQGTYALLEVTMKMDLDVESNLDHDLDRFRVLQVPGLMYLMRS